MNYQKMYLYIKRSPKGLFYLGKCNTDPFKYKGSGKIWKRHLKKYNVSAKDIDTYILLETSNEDELIQFGRYYSKLLNVVEDSNWANLRIEEGDGGNTTQGKVWVTNGNTDRFIYPNEIEEGFSRGRSITKGDKNHMKNKEKARQLHLIQKIKVEQIDPSNDKVVAVHDSMTEAAIAIGTDQGRISRCCKFGFISKGYKFKIKE